MKDLALDSINGDLAAGSDIGLVTGAQAIAQVIGIRLNFQKGEWFLNPPVGVPYVERILGQKFNIGIIRQTFASVIETAPGVTDLESLEIELDANRALRVIWSARVDSGEVIAGTETLIFGDPPVDTARPIEEG